MNAIAECESVNSRRVPMLTKSSTQRSKSSSTVSNACVPSLPRSNFVSASLMKSLNYVRSLVARHTPKLSFQPVMQTTASTSAKQLLPTLSSLLTRSFTSHLSPEVVSSKDALEIKEPSGPSASALSNIEEVDGEGNKYIFSDILKWRWPGEGEYRMSCLTKERYSTNIF